MYAHMFVVFLDPYKDKTAAKLQSNAEINTLCAHGYIA